MSEWKVFFERNKDKRIEMSFYEIEDAVSIEELYQHFKQRMVAELNLPQPPKDK